MRHSEKLAAGLFLGCAAWFVVSLLALGGTEGPLLVHFSELGQGLGPLGAVLTAATLWFAIDQHRATSRTAQINAVLDAYATWFQTSRGEIQEMVHEAGLVARYTAGIALTLKTEAEASKNSAIRSDDFIHDVYRRYDALVSSSMRIQLLDDDAETGAMLDEFLRSLPSAPSAYSMLFMNEAELAKTADKFGVWSAEIAQRRDQFFALFQHVGRRARHGRQLAIAPFRESDKAEITPTR
jgi:hypothetical protein